jgi:hypothetical protein
MGSTWLIKIVNNPLISVISIILAIINIILMVVFYFKSRREKKTRFSINSTTLIESTKTALTDLEILYKNQKQERITVSKLAIWNAGSDPLRSDDIATAFPLAIEVAEGAEVLSADVVFTTDEANRFTLGHVKQSIDGKKQTLIPFSFEYLDKREGVVIQIVHTGEASHKISVTGKVISGLPLKHIESPYQKMSHLYRQIMNPTYPKVLLQIYLVIFAIGVVLILTISKSAGIPMAVIGAIGMIGIVVNSTIFTIIPRDMLKKMK